MFTEYEESVPAVAAARPLESPQGLLLLQDEVRSVEGRASREISEDGLVVGESFVGDAREPDPL